MAALEQPDLWTVPGGMKRCRGCQEVKPVEAFNHRKMSRDNYDFRCRQCTLAARRKRAAAKPARPKPQPRPFDPYLSYMQGIRARYGVSPEQYQHMFEMQGGVCAICGEPERPSEAAIKRATRHGHLSVDHDHKTGQIRALLCAKCNIGLGHFRDDLDLLRRAAEYLAKWQPAT